MRRMPWTGTLFLIGSFAICGLPPLNGFVSEFLIYVGAFMGTGLSGVSLSSIGVIAGLAAIGGLAAACFTKAFGIVFLGEPRHTPALQGHEIGWGMRIPMLILALGCLSIGLLAPFIISAMNPVIGNVTGLLKNDIGAHLAVVTLPLQQVTALSMHFHPDTGALDLSAQAPAFRQNTRAKQHVGLRFYQAHSPHAVYGILLRTTHHRHVRLFFADTSKDSCAGRAFPGQGQPAYPYR